MKRLLPFPAPPSELPGELARRLAVKCISLQDKHIVFFISSWAWQGLWDDDNSSGWQ